MLITKNLSSLKKEYLQELQTLTSDNIRMKIYDDLKVKEYGYFIKKKRTDIKKGDLKLLIDIFANKSSDGDSSEFISLLEQFYDSLSIKENSYITKDFTSFSNNFLETEPAQISLSLKTLQRSLNRLKQKLNKLKNNLDVLDAKLDLKAL